MTTLIQSEQRTSERSPTRECGRRTGHYYPHQPAPVLLAHGIRDSRPFQATDAELIKLSEQTFQPIRMASAAIFEGEPHRSDTASRNATANGPDHGTAVSRSRRRNK